MTLAPPAIRGVLLDIDDTLVVTREAFGAGIAAVAREHLPGLSDDEIAEATAMWRADASGHYRRYTRGELTKDEQRMRRANELHARFGGALLNTETFPAWDAVFWSAFEGAWRPFEEAADVVDGLLSAGFALGALTNAESEMSQRKLAATGFGERVPLLVSLSTLGVGKPDPRVFQEGVRRLGLAPEETVYVGDELDIDALAAQEAGLRGVWLDRPGARRGGVHLEDPEVARERGIPVIASLAELPEVLASR